MNGIKKLIVPIAVCALIGGIHSIAWSHIASEPGAYSGSPGDRASCSFCHGMRNKDKPLPAKIPNSPYVRLSPIPRTYQAGKSYPFTLTFTAKTTTADTAPAKLYGFQITAEKAGGVKVGSWTVVDDNTALVKGVTAVGHRNATRTTTSWNLQWNAPESAGSGKVTFYINCVAGNGDGYMGGDDTHVKIYSLNEEGGNVPAPATESPAKGADAKAAEEKLDAIGEKKGS